MNNYKWLVFIGIIVFSYNSYNSFSNHPNTNTFIQFELTQLILFVIIINFMIEHIMILHNEDIGNIKQLHRLNINDIRNKIVKLLKKAKSDEDYTNDYLKSFDEQYVII